VLKVAIPRPSSDAVFRSGQRTAWRSGFDDEADEAAAHRYTRAEAEALRRRDPVLSPWIVVLSQVVVGIVVAAMAAWLVDARVALSALYGSAVVALPGALMARGATSRLSALSPPVSALSMLGWEMVKVAVSIVMLVLAPRVVDGLSWPAMLATMVLCMQSYWLALLWRPRRP